MRERMGHMSNSFAILSYRHSIFIVFARLFRLQIQFFANYRSPNRFINVMASHNAVVVSLHTE